MNPKVATKVYDWDGRNKRAVREEKLELITRLQKEGFLPEPEQLKMLSFAGSQALLEHQLVKAGNCLAKNITTIQTYTKIGGNDSRESLDLLLENRKDGLEEMLIWPYDFSAFVDNYLHDETTIPNLGQGREPIWYLNQNYKSEMLRFRQRPAHPFSIVDLDLCGNFSEIVGADIAKLFSARKVADQAVVFFTCQKGRDGRNGKLYNFVEEYFGSDDYFNLAWVPEFDPREESPESYNAIRRRLVPSFFAREAFRGGYDLTPIEMIEYSDRNKTTAGVYMNQWFFLMQRITGLSNPKTKDAFRQKLYNIARQSGNGAYTFIPLEA